MRICDVNSFYSPTGGGIRIYHNRKLDHFSELPEHSISLVVPGETEGCVVEGNTSTYRVRSLPLLNSGYRLILESGGLSSVFGEFRPDIVEIGSPYLLPILARSALGDAEVPTVGFYHADYPDSYVGPFAGKYLPPKLADMLTALSRRHAARVYGNMTAVFAASRCMLMKLHRAGLKRLFLTPLGVDTEQFMPSKRSDDFRRRAGVTGRKMLILYLARLHGEKGIDLLMKAYPFFRDPGSLTLAVGGHGPAEGRLRQFIERYPEVIRLPHMSDREMVAEAMASADVFLSLGLSETFGLAGLEAVASGAVPVFPDSGASGEMATSLGLLPPFRSGDPESLADAVRSATELCGPDSTEFLYRFALNGYTWNSVFQRIEKFYERIIKAYHAGNVSSLDAPDKWWDH